MVEHTRRKPTNIKSCRDLTDWLSENNMFDILCGMMEKGIKEIQYKLYIERMHLIQVRSTNHFILSLYVRF